MNLNQIIGENIKTLRQEKKMSQENLAGIAEIDRRYIQSIEKGRRNISLNTLYKISKALDIKMSDIIIKIENEL